MLPALLAAEVKVSMKKVACKSEINHISEATSG
jgi:hypothetical protein